MPAPVERPKGQTAPDVVQEASEASFPASDPPAYGGHTSLGVPHEGPIAPEAAEPTVAPIEITEHAVTDPAARSA